MPQPQTILVTGGAGFIGSAVVRLLIAETQARVVNLDAMTYAASGTALAAVEGNPRYAFERADIRDAEALAAAFDRSEAHTSELQSLMRISSAVFCLQKKTAH